MKIQSIPKSQLKQNELLEAGRSVEAKINEIGAASLGIEAAFANYQTSLQAYDNSLVKLPKSSYTAEMQAQDKLRDTCQTNLLNQIRTGVSHFDPKKQEAGKRLLPVANRFRGGTQLGFNEQTGMTANLIQILREEERKKDVQTLELTGWIDQLETLNNECARLANLRREENGARNIPQKASVTRTAFNKAYDALVEMLNALAIVNGEEKYADLFRWWNAMIDEYRTLIALRKGAGQGGQTDGGDSTQPGEGGTDGGDSESPDEI